MEQFVEVLLGAGLLEGKDADDNDEEDDSHGEYVRLPPVIFQAQLYFRSHVGHGSADRFK